MSGASGRAARAAAAISLALEARIESELLGDTESARDPVDPSAPEVETGASRLAPAMALVARFYFW